MTERRRQEMRFRIVERCAECDQSYFDHDDLNILCDENHKVIGKIKEKDNLSIPVWCPLYTLEQMKKFIRHYEENK